MQPRWRFGSFQCRCVRQRPVDLEEYFCQSSSRNCARSQKVCRVGRPLEKAFVEDVDFFLLNATVQRSAWGQRSASTAWYGFKVSAAGFIMLGPGHLRARTAIAEKAQQGWDNAVG